MEEIDKLNYDEESLLLNEVICGDHELLYIDTLLSEIFGAK